MRLAFHTWPESQLKPIRGPPPRDLPCGRAWLRECLPNGQVTKNLHSPDKGWRQGWAHLLVLGNQAQNLKTRSGFDLWSDAATCWLAGRLRASRERLEQMEPVTGSYSLGFHVHAPMIGCLVEVKC